MVEKLGAQQERVDLSALSGEVVNSYTAFQSQAKNGFDGHQDRLASYGNFVYNLNRFFSDPDIVKSPQAYQLVQNLFYQHEASGAMPVEFCIETREELRQDVLEGGYMKSGGPKWQKELDVVKVAVEGELKRVTLAYHQERTNVDKIEALSAQAVKSPELIVQARDETVRRIETAAVEVLAADKRPETADLRGDIHLRNRVIADIEALLSQGNESLTPRRIQELLARYQTNLALSDQEYPLSEELVDRAEDGQFGVVRKRLEALSEELEDPSYLFRVWSDKGLVPAPLVESYDEIITLSHLQEVAEQSKGLPKAQIAKAVAPFLNKDISSELLLEVIEGNFAFADDILAVQVESFLNFYDGITNQKPRKAQSKLPELPTLLQSRSAVKRAAIAAALVGVVSGATIIYLKSNEVQQPQTLLEQVASEIPAENLERPERQWTQRPTPPIMGPMVPNQEGRPIDNKGYDSLEAVSGYDIGSIDTTIDPFSESGLGSGDSEGDAIGEGQAREGTNQSGKSGGLRVEVKPAKQTAQASAGSQTEGVPASGSGESSSESNQSSAQPGRSESTGGPAPASSSPETRTNPNTVNGSSDSLKPTVDSAEDLEKDRQTVVWAIEGENLWGYYRQGSATYYSYDKKEWVVDRRAERPENSILTDSSDIRFQGGFTIGTQIIELPIRNGHALTNGTIEIEGNVKSPAVIQTANGSYLLYFDKEDKGKQITVKFGIGESIVSSTYSPDETELSRMSTPLFSEGLFSPTDKEFFDQLRKNPNLDDLTKAKLMERYVQTSFLYSLDPEVAAMLNSTPSGREFFRTLLEDRRGDCDVTNTALVGFLRLSGIRARMAYGFAHTGGPFSKDITSLVKSEGHGWVEVYIKGQWIILDGTPVTMDDYTKEVIKKNLPPQSNLDSSLDQQRQADQSGSGPGRGQRPDETPGGESDKESRERTRQSTDPTVRRDANGRIVPGQETQEEQKRETGRLTVRRSKEAGNGRGGPGPGGSGSGTGEGKGAGGGQGSESDGKGPGAPKVGEGGSKKEATEEMKEFISMWESIKSFADENKYPLAVLAGVLVNSFLYYQGARLRNKNNALSKRYIVELEKRFKTYFGEQVNESILGNSLYHWEWLKVADLQTGSYTRRQDILYSGIPGSALGGLWGLRKAHLLGRIPYASVDTGQITQSINPTAFEFFTKVLGYPERDAKASLLTEAYFRQRSRVEDQQWSVESAAFPFYEMFLGVDAQATKFISELYKPLNKLSTREPRTIQDWEMSQQAITDRGYERYLSRYSAAGKIRANWNQEAQNAEEVVEIPVPITKEEFSVRMDILYSHLEVGWLMRKTYQQAMKDLAPKD